jgi:hypothetical protein
MVGCQQKSGGVHEIEQTRMATKPHAPADPNMSSAQRFGFQMPQERPAMATAQGPAFRWETPVGWENLPPRPMRDVNLAVGEETECYVSALSSSGGGLAANVNRWRQQMGLAPESEDWIAALPPIEVMGLEGRLVELEGTYSGMRGDQNAEGYKMLAAFVPAGDRTVTIKMIGPSEQVTAERQNFESFAASLSLADAADHAGHDHAEHAEGGTHESVGGLAFDVPEGWSRAGERPMRLVTYVLSDGETECYISPLSGTGGGVEANLNRWLGQMGREPMSADAIAALPKLTVLGQEVALLETSGTFTSMRGDAKPGYALAGVFVPMSETSYSIKLIGPEEEVAASKATFIAFCESLHTH